GGWPGAAYRSLVGVGVGAAGAGVGAAGITCGPLDGTACGPLGGTACGPLGGTPPAGSRRSGGSVDGECERPPGGAFGGGSGAFGGTGGASFGGGIPASVDDAGGLGFCPGPSPSDDDMRASYSILVARVIGRAERDRRRAPAICGSQRQ